jgi:hypothetical protein
VADPDPVAASAPAAAAPPAASAPPATATAAPAQGPAGPAPALHARIADRGIVALGPPRPGALMAGTEIRIRLLEDLSSAVPREGTPCRSRVASDVLEDGKVLIPQGTEISGRVSHVTSGNHLGAKATLRLRPEVMTLPDGSRFDIHAQVVGSGVPGLKANSEGAIQRESHPKKIAGEYALGAGGGAILGAAVAGPTGAVVGTLIGAGLTTTHVLKQNPQADLPSDSEIVLSLTEPLDLVPAQRAAAR